MQEVSRILQAREPAELAQQDAQVGERNSMELTAPVATPLWPSVGVKPNAWKS
jgi:hypothetical protein